MQWVRTDYLLFKVPAPFLSFPAVTGAGGFRKCRKERNYRHFHITRGCLMMISPKDILTN